MPSAPIGVGRNAFVGPTGRSHFPLSRAGSMTKRTRLWNTNSFCLFQVPTWSRRQPRAVQHDIDGVRGLHRALAHVDEG